MVCAEVDIARATKMIIAGTSWSFFFAEYNDFILLNATTSRKTDHSSVKFCAIVIPIVWSEDLCARRSNDGATFPDLRIPGNLLLNLACEQKTTLYRFHRSHWHHRFKSRTVSRILARCPRLHAFTHRASEK